MTDEPELHIAVNTRDISDLLVAGLSCSGGSAVAIGFLESQAQAACDAVQASIAVGPNGETRSLTDPPPATTCVEDVTGTDDPGFSATIYGTIDGRAVDQTFSRSSPCARNDWDALHPILPDTTQLDQAIADYVPPK